MKRTLRMLLDFAESQADSVADADDVFVCFAPSNKSIRCLGLVDGIPIVPVIEVWESLLQAEEDLNPPPPILDKEVALESNETIVESDAIIEREIESCTVSTFSSAVDIHAYATATISTPTGGGINSCEIGRASCRERV